MGLTAEQLFAGAPVLSTTTPPVEVKAPGTPAAAPKGLSADELFADTPKTPSAPFSIPAPIRQSLHLLKGLGGEAAAGADFFANIFSQALQTGAYASARGLGIAAGEPAAQGAKEAQEIAQKVGDVLSDPFEKLLGVMGAGGVEKGTKVKAVEGKISDLIDKAATKVQDLTGGRVRKEDVEANFGALMTGLGFKGGDVLEGKIADLARRRAQGKSAPREPGGEPTEDEVNSAYADWNAGLGEEEPAGGAGGGAEPEGSVYETQPPAPPTGPSMGDYLRAKKKPGFERSAEDLMTIRRFEQSGQIDPELLKRLGLVSAGAALGTLLDPNHPEGGMLGAGLGLLGGLMRGRGDEVPSAFRQSGAVKGPGGVWDPKVADNLTWKLTSHMLPTLSEMDVSLSDAQRTEQFKGLLGQSHDWATKAVTRYLNKYAATEKDPLKDIVLPGGETWGQAWDGAVKSREEEGPHGPEKVWHVKLDNYEQGYGYDHLLNYLDHVGEYMKQRVPRAKWGQYDLTRAVKETAEHDKRMAEQAEKANVDTTANLPVYKEYPDGFKWVEIKAPKKLSEEQAKGVRPTGYKAYVKERYGVKGDLPEQYVAVDEKGEPVVNAFTGAESKGNSPEEAWTAGQLAREGNQMGHCVGGYCGEVTSGKARIYSLRDAKGRSHVTVEVAPPTILERLRELTPEEDMRLKSDLESRGYRLVEGHWRNRDGDFLERRDLKRALDRAAPEALDRTPSAIEQIKGKANGKPASKYIPYVQDFVKSQPWQDVADLQHTDLHPLLTNRGTVYPPEWSAQDSPQSRLLHAHPQDLGLPPGYYTEPELRAAAEKAMEGRTNLPRSEKGQIDRALLTSLAAAGLGAASAAYVDPQSPISAAIIGGVAGLWMAGGIRAALKHSPEEAAQARNISDNLHRLVTRALERQMGLLRYLAANTPKDYQQHAADIYRSYEHPEMKLSPRAQELKENLVEPVRRGNERIREALRKLGVDVGPDVLENYVHRMQRGAGRSIFEEIAQNSAHVTRKGLSRVAPSLKQRIAFALEDGEGNRLIVTDAGGGKLTVWKNGKAVGRARRIGSKPVKYKGREWTRREATTDEIEGATQLRYYHDALGTAVDENVRLGRALENAMFIEGLKTLPSFSDIALPAGEAPTDWKTVSIPQLQQYRFAPQVAETLQDYSGELKDTPAVGLAHIGRVLIGSLFWNPLPHIFNILDHAFVGRGATALINPLAYVRGARTAFQAWKEVSEQGPIYRRMLHAGAGLMYPNIAMRGFGEQVMRQLGHAPEGSALSTALGYANPLEMVRRVYAFSRQNLWFWNDVIMMQAYLEKSEIAGKTPEEVMHSVEKHIPNYRVPERVLGSRLLSHALQNPLVTAFGRYDYGRLRSYGAMVKDLVGKSVPLRDRARALDQMAALGIAGLVIYPMILDRAAQALTGNPRASFQRFGANTIPYLLYEYMSGAKDLSQTVESMFPQSPIPQLFEEVLNNRNLFTGQRLFVTPKDVMQWAAKQFNPLYIVGQVQSGKMSPEQFFLQSIGIKSPTAEQELHRREYRERERAAARNRRQRESQ